ncbi:MAG: hypothetical protein AAF611_02810 [Bacteroidota bacterium]
MKITAIDLRKITPHYLRMGFPVSKWPKADIFLEDFLHETCIASWKWDISSIDEVSNNLSECAWDGFHLGFSFLLSDIVSINQNSENFINELIKFNSLYEKLHAVISYSVDPQMQRTWLKNEAIKILNSPTNLGYAIHKWRLKIPLIPNLIIRQICTRRLGIQAIKYDNLKRIEGEKALYLTLKQLELFDKKNTPINSINVDRRSQTFASDIILVYELSKEQNKYNIIKYLSSLKTNSVYIPALLCIWAFIDRFSISIRGCDWDINNILEKLSEFFNYLKKIFPLNINLTKSDKNIIYKFNGVVNGNLDIEFANISKWNQQKYKDILLRLNNLPCPANSDEIRSKILVFCVKYVVELKQNKNLQEPEPLSHKSPQYSLGFDNNSHDSELGMSSGNFNDDELKTDRGN